MFTDILSKQLYNFVCNSRKEICVNMQFKNFKVRRKLMNANKLELFIMKVPNYFSK